MGFNSEMSVKSEENVASRISAKVSYEGDIRRFSFERTANFSEVWKVILKLFNLEQESNVKLYYVDDENDLVVMSCDLELVEALNILESVSSKSSLLRLQLKSVSNEMKAPQTELNVPQAPETDETNEQLRQKFKTEREALQQRIRESRQQFKARNRELRLSLCSQRAEEKKRFKQQIKEERQKFKLQKRELKKQLMEERRASSKEENGVEKSLQQLQLSETSSTPEENQALDETRGCLPIVSHEDM